MLIKKGAKKTAIVAFVLLVAFVFTSCASVSETLSLYRRKIGRVDLINQQADLFDSDTSITQLISMEQRTANYNFSGDTTIAYDTTFLTVPATVVYSFDNNGKLSNIEYFIDFSKANVEDEVMDVYNECIKFFSFPDEGYTRGIYKYLYQNPQVLWIKNNAQIALEFSLDNDLNAHAHLSYYRSEWSGSSLAVFKLPFSPHALGDGILSVVSHETKKNSERTPSVVGYTYTSNDKKAMTVEYVFRGDTLKEIKMMLIGDVENMRQMGNLTENMILFMDETFVGAFKQSSTNDKAYNVMWSGESTDINLNSAKDSGNREMTVTVSFNEFLN